MDFAGSEGVKRTFGLHRIDHVLKNPDNIVLPIFGCQCIGFGFEPDEYRADNMRLVNTKVEKAKVIAMAPRDGLYYPGFVFYDSAAACHEVVEIFVNEQYKGRAVADLNDNNQYLFFLSTPVNFRRGDRLELRVNKPPSDAHLCYRVEDLVFMKRPPVPREPVYEFRHMAERENRVMWVTTWSTQCTLELDSGTHITEDEPFNNHRIELKELEPGQTVRYRIRARTRKGFEIYSDWREYTRRQTQEPSTTKTGEVKLHVSVPMESGFSPWPVTSGVPFPEGHLGSSGQARLISVSTHGGKEEVPLQASVTGRWPDGSVKWLLLDFHHSGPSADYILQYGPDISSRSFPGNPSVTLPDPLGTLALKDENGLESRVEVRLSDDGREESGPLRQCFRAAGSLHGERFAYEMRAHTHPGTPWVRVLFTFCTNITGEETDFTTIQSLLWEMPVRSLGEQNVHQHYDDSYESSAENGERWSGPLGPVRMRDFWQNYPKALDIVNNVATLWLLPTLGPNEYEEWLIKHNAPQDNDELLRKRLFFWFVSLPSHPSSDAGSGGYRLRQGMTKTHEVWIGLDGSQPQLDRPLFAVCDPNWYADSLAFGPIAIADSHRRVVQDYDRQVASLYDAYMTKREADREYGMFNFGDWCGERTNNWGNLEYDTSHAFFLQFIRSGDERFLWVAGEAATHGRDIDTIHCHCKLCEAGDTKRHKQLGQVYQHCVGHVGDYYTQAEIAEGTAGSSCRSDHTWIEGYFDHYFLTGDRRSLETGLMIADHQARYGTTNYDFLNCREPAWLLTLCMAAYRGTGDPYYMNASHIIVDRVLERQTMTPALGTAGGGWRRRLVQGHCNCCGPSKHYGNVNFMIGILLTGLRWYFEEQDVQARKRKPVANSIYRASQFLIEDMWEADNRTFRFCSCPNASIQFSVSTAYCNFLLFDGMSLAYQITGDRNIADVLAVGVDVAIEKMSNILKKQDRGKLIGMCTRAAPHSLQTLADLVEPM